MAVIGIGSAAARMLTGGSSLSVNVTRPMALPRQVTDPISLTSRSGIVAAASRGPAYAPSGNANPQNIIGGGGQVRTPSQNQMVGGSGVSIPVVVNTPMTGGAVYVPVPPPVAQAIAAGDPNAAAAVNAAYGGAPGGYASPGPVSASGSSSAAAEGDVWGPRLFGLGIIAAGAVLVLVLGKHAK